MIDLSKLGLFLAFFGVAAILLAAFLTLYTVITPIREWELLRTGNQAVALSLGGAIIGFALPLASAIQQTHNLWDMVITAVIASIVQLACSEAMSLLRRDRGKALEEGDMAEAILRAAISVAIGLLNAACLT